MKHFGLQILTDISNIWDTKPYCFKYFRVYILVVHLYKIGKENELNYLQKILNCVKMIAKCSQIV